jgi:hypothetical protein
MITYVGSGRGTRRSRRHTSSPSAFGIIQSKMASFGGFGPSSTAHAASPSATAVTWYPHSASVAFSAQR